ncbi:protein phosphatase 2C domain-containing protein, partial [Actinomadura sp. CNU-125]|uniref:protein phosphatase 2C domain-containing protein n=1 Tax=Actinomadura sp. CNU-125 TaxID=1904961 RepID=UPI0011776407
PSAYERPPAGSSPAGLVPGGHARATPPPESATAHRAAGRFPRPLGTSGKANALPWLLPPEPGPSGIAADAATVGELRVRAASLIGPGHRCEEPAAPRQDAYRLAVDRERRHLIVAVADGMTSSDHSHLGASVATMLLVQQVWAGGTDDADDAAAHAWFTEAARHMAGAADQRGLKHAQVRAAALVALIDIEPAADGCRRVRVWTIADVGAWLGKDRTWQQVAGDVRTGFDRSKLHSYLPHHPDHARGVSFRLEPGAVLALTTDGVGDALGRPDLGPWFADQWAEPPHISDFVDTVGFEAKGELDDRTAVVVWAPGPGADR